MDANDQLPQLIRRAIEEQIRELVNQEAELAARRVENGVRVRTAQIVANVFRRFTVTRMGSDLRIEVVFNPEEKEKV